jgi:5-methylcytosine-specific restriction endonuclease McrA
MSRERVVVPPRKDPTKTQKVAAWNRENGLCYLCGKPVALEGSGVQYDHRDGRAVSANDETDNLYPVHPVCHAPKTAKVDTPRAAKTKRQEKLTRAKVGSKRGLSPPPGARYDWSRGRYVRDEP